jgi:hypothetical protein
MGPHFKGATLGKSTLWGVIVGAGLGALAVKKGEPLVKNAMLKYVTSQAAGATDQNVPTDQAAAVSPTT